MLFEIRKPYKRITFITAVNVTAQIETCTLMAFVIGDDIEEEIRLTFSDRGEEATSSADESIKNVLFIIIYFLTKWKQECIDHGVSVMKLIVEKEKLQASELQSQIEASLQQLEPFKDQLEFEKQNEIKKKKLLKHKKNLRHTKQSKFQMDRDDWAKGEIFDLTKIRARSTSKKLWQWSHSSTRGAPNTSERNEDTERMVVFLGQEHSPGSNNYYQRDPKAHKRNRRKRKRKIQECWGQRRNNQGQYPEPAEMTEIISPLSLDITALNPHPDHYSKTIINLSEFKLEERHRKLLEKGLSYSPTGSRNEFEVYKDITLFLGKV